MNKSDKARVEDHEARIRRIDNSVNALQTEFRAINKKLAEEHSRVNTALSDYQDHLKTIVDHIRALEKSEYPPIGRWAQGLVDRVDTLKQGHGINPTPQEKNILVVVDRNESAVALTNIAGLLLGGLHCVKIMKAQKIQVSNGYTFHFRPVEDWSEGTLRGMFFDDVFYLTKAPLFVKAAVSICTKKGD